MAISFAFVIFFAGSGQLDGSAIRLQMVNITFTRPGVVSLAAWVLIMAFAVRWWQLSRGMLLAKMRQELHGSGGSFFARAYIRKRFQGDKPESMVFRPDLGYDFDIAAPPATRLTFRYAVNGSSTNFQTSNLEVSGLDGHLLLAYTYTRNALTKPTASQFGLPWLLFFAAISAPLWSR